jgi:hypothetical protein
MIKVPNVISLHFIQKPIEKHQLLKPQIPSIKWQTNLKFQYSTRGASACAARDQQHRIGTFSHNGHFAFGVFVWDFEFRSLGFIWYLIFVFWDFRLARLWRVYPGWGIGASDICI